MCYAARIIETVYHSDSMSSTMEHTVYFNVPTAERVTAELETHLQKLGTKNDLQVLIYHCRVMDNFRRDRITLPQ